MRVAALLLKAALPATAAEWTPQPFVVPLLTNGNIHAQLEAACKWATRDPHRAGQEVTQEITKGSSSFSQ